MVADPAGDLPPECGTVAGAVVGDHQVDGPAGLVSSSGSPAGTPPRTRC